MTDRDSGVTDEPATAGRTERRRLVGDLAVTTAVISAILALVFRYFALYDKSFVWYFDGLAQHFPALYYFNTWVRGIMSNPGAGIPLWSWDMGLGADIIGTLAFPVVGDPFALLSLLFPLAGLETAYAVILVVRSICAGAAAALYLRLMGSKPLPGLVGATIYLFATFLLVQSRHPYFINAMVFLPLVLIGMEAALAGRRPWVLTVVVFFAAAANFYFFYILTLIAVVYVVARYFEVTAPDARWRSLARVGLRVAGYYALGIALAAPLLFSAAAAVMATARSQADFAIGALYPLKDYASMLTALTSLGIGARSTLLGFAYLGLLLAPLVFLRRGHNSALKFMLVSYVAFIGLPLFGALFNGLTFPSNRFSFGFGLFVALAAASFLSEDRVLTPREMRLMYGAFAGYALLVTVIAGGFAANVATPMMLGGLTVAVFAFERSRGAREPDAWRPVPVRLPARWRAPLTRWAIYGLLLANVLANATLLHDARFGDHLHDFVDRGTVLERYRENTGRIASELPRDHFYRVTNSDTLYYNSAMVQGFPGTSFYFSAMSGPLTDFRVEMDTAGGWSSFSYDGFDDRATLSSLLGVEYYLAREGEDDFVPYGFEEYLRDGDARAFRSSHALPLGFVYDGAIARSDYERLAPVDRQAALLQGAVVDDADVGTMPRVRPEGWAREVPFSVASTKGASVDLQAGTIVRTKADSSILVTFTPVPESETYIEIRDFDNQVESPLQRRARKTGHEPSVLDRARLLRETMAFQQPGSLTVSYRAHGASKREKWMSPESTYYWGNRSQLVNLGYRSEGIGRARVEVKGKGTLTFKSLKVYALPMERFSDRAGALRAKGMRDIRVSANRVTGQTASDTPGILFLSIPYSTGWHAEVDGVPVRVLRVNTGFIGVPVGEGAHAVTLKYFTPGLRTGLWLSGAALLGVAVLLVVGIRRRRTRVGRNTPTGI